MEIGVREQGESGPVRLIDLTEQESEAPFAVREGEDGPIGRAGQQAAKPNLWSWFGDHPVVVGVATGVICFTIIATAVSLTFGSESNETGDNPAAGAAISETDGGRGSFSGDSSNFTSDDPKRTGNVGAPKVLAESGQSNGSDNNAESAMPAAPSVGDDAANVDIDANAPTGDDTSATNNGDNNNTDDDSVDNDSDSDSNSNPFGSTPTSLRRTTTTARTQNTNGAVTTRATSTTRRTSTTRATSTTQATSTTRGTAPTTAATTPSTSASITSTTTTTTTTSTTSTTQPPVDVRLIAAPADYSAHALETASSFAANVQLGATQYCWRFSQSGLSHGPFCASGTTYQLPAGALGMEPGLVTVTATATGGSVNKSETIRVILTRSRIFAQPRDGASSKFGRTLPVRLVEIVGGTNYCLTFYQGGSVVFGQACYGLDQGNTFNRNHAIWDAIAPGSLTIRAKVTGSGKVLAVDDVTITLTE